MACNNEIHQNDTGTEFIVTIMECLNGVDTPLDISSSIAKEIVFQKADGSSVVFTAEYTLPQSGGSGTGSDGKLSYFTLYEDLSPAGSFKIQGIVTTPSGKWYSTIDKFKVKANL